MQELPVMLLDNNCVSCMYYLTRLAYLIINNIAKQFL